MLVRNLIGFVGAAALYIASVYVLHFLELKGRDALLVLFVLHACFGVIGYFIFVGRTLVRASGVFLVIVSYGIVSEIIVPDERHAFAQIVVASAFGFLAAAATHGGKILERIWITGRKTGQT